MPLRRTVRTDRFVIVRSPLNDIRERSQSQDSL